MEKDVITQTLPNPRPIHKSNVQKNPMKKKVNRIV